MSYCIIQSENFRHFIDEIAKRINKIAIVLIRNANDHGLLEMGILAQKNQTKHAICLYN